MKNDLFIPCSCWLGCLYELLLGNCICHPNYFIYIFLIFFMGYSWRLSNSIWVREGEDSRGSWTGAGGRGNLAAATQ